MANIIVAGGSGTLGRAVVAELIGRGHRVVVVDIAAFPSPSDLAADLSGVDLADETDVAHAFETAATALTSIDGLVNVAGGFLWELVDEGSLENWDMMYRVNLRTVAVAGRAIIKHLAAEGGAIVNVGAAAASNPAIGMAAYAASKAGVMALTESLAEELKSRFIRVNAVLPTIIDTPANRRNMPDADTRNWVQPSDAARVIEFLLSPDAFAISGVGIKLSLGRPAD